MVMLSHTEIEVPWTVKSAGTIDTDEWYVESTGETSRRITMTCPECQRKVRPFMQRVEKPKYTGTEYPWVGCDYQNIVDKYLVTHTACKKQFRFGLLFQQ